MVCVKDRLCLLDDDGHTAIHAYPVELAETLIKRIPVLPEVGRELERSGELAEQLVEGPHPFPSEQADERATCSQPFENPPDGHLVGRPVPWIGPCRG